MAAKNKKNVIVFIDAGYLSHLTYHYGSDGKHLKFKIEDLAINLAKHVNKWCTEIYYYTAPPYQSQNPTEEEKRKKSGYDKLISKLRNSKKIINIREGRCIKPTFGKPIQKGVDVWMTIDILRVAQRKEADEIILITADTDFVPLLKVVREEYNLKISLGYIAGEKNGKKLYLSNYLLQNCDTPIFLEKEFFETRNRN